MKRISDEAEARKADTEYRRGIHQAMFLALTANGILTEDQAKEVVIMLAKGQIPYAKINY